MSVSLLEVIEAGGYDLTTYDDALWLLSKRAEFEYLIDEADEIIEKRDQGLHDKLSEEDYI